MTLEIEANEYAIIGSKLSVCNAQKEILSPRKIDGPAFLHSFDKYIFEQTWSVSI